MDFSLRELSSAAEVGDESAPQPLQEAFALAPVGKQGLFGPVLAFSNDHFPKTGSGQAYRGGMENSSFNLKTTVEHLISAGGDRRPDEKAGIAGSEAGAARVHAVAGRWKAGC